MANCPSSMTRVGWRNPRCAGWGRLVRSRRSKKYCMTSSNISPSGFRQMVRQESSDSFVQWRTTQKLFFAVLLHQKMWLSLPFQEVLSHHGPKCRNSIQRQEHGCRHSGEVRGQGQRRLRRRVPKVQASFSRGRNLLEQMGAQPSVSSKET